MNAAEYNSIVGLMRKEGLAGPARQSFLGYDNDKDLKACFPMTQLSYKYSQMLRGWTFVLSDIFYNIDGHSITPFHMITGQGLQISML